MSMNVTAAPRLEPRTLVVRPYENVPRAITRLLDGATLHREPPVKEHAVRLAEHRGYASSGSPRSAALYFDPTRIELFEEAVINPNTRVSTVEVRGPVRVPSVLLHALSAPLGEAYEVERTRQLGSLTKERDALRVSLSQKINRPVQVTFRMQAELAVLERQVLQLEGKSLLVLRPSAALRAAARRAGDELRVAVDSQRRGLERYTPRRALEHGRLAVLQDRLDALSALVK